MVFAADEATDGLLDLEFVAVWSGPSLVCLVALAWQEGGAAPGDFVYVVLVWYWFFGARKKFQGLTLTGCTWQWPCWRHCLDSEELLSRVKTYDLALIGWVTAMAVRARTVSSLVALSWEPYSKSRCCYGNEGGKELKMKLYVVVCYGMIFCHVALLFILFYRLCAS